MNISVDLQVCQTQLLQAFHSSQPADTNCLKLLPLSQYEEVETLCKGPFAAPFSVFNPDHSSFSRKIVDILMEPQNFTSFLMTVMLLRECVKPDIFYFSLATVLKTRSEFDAKMQLPHPFYVMPSRFFLGYTFVDNSTRGKIIFDYNMTFNKGTVLTDAKDGVSPEQQLAYFREDVALNSFHWHWHTLHPVESFLKPTIHTSDRRGEDFFFAHRQILRRYNAERFAFKLKQVETVEDWLAPIEPGYNSHLYAHAYNTPYPPRYTGMRLHDIFIPEMLTVDYFLLIIQRIKEAIAQGYVVKPDGTKVELTVQNGTDILGAIIQSNPTTPNLKYYGSLHHVGHILLAQVVQRVTNIWELSMMGVIGYSETSMRDPFFYMWHRFLDELFILHKDKLPPYTEDELNWSEVDIRYVDILNQEKEAVNKLYTYFEERNLLVSNDIDFMFPNASVAAKIVHLQHDQFDYVIRVKNPTAKVLDATVRIYLAPAHNENGKEATDQELHEMFFEMDRFKASIPPGLHLILKSSINTSVALTPHRTWHNLQQDPFIYESVTDNDVVCECGWPHHLLIPRGREDGMHFKLLVMITDWNIDKVENSTGTLYPKCNYGISLCGIVQGLFPDSRPMGFPFDRPPKFDNMTSHSRQFFKRSNMFLSDLVIYHRNEVRPAKLIKEENVEVSSIL